MKLIACMHACIYMHIIGLYPDMCLWHPAFQIDLVYMYRDFVKTII